MEERGIHRGLLKGDMNPKKASLHIAKAEHNLHAALFFESSGYGDWSASAAFYYIYHSFLAILAQHGYESRNQECTLAVIEMLKEEGNIVIDGKLINTLKITLAKEDEPNAIRLREDFQYGIEVEFNKKEQFLALVQQSKETLAAAKGIIANQKP